jgi:hypothetical protein
LPEGTVVATLRDGNYHSDYSGRSHVGIYLSHEDYQEYKVSQDRKSGVWLFDQFNANAIGKRHYLYAIDADEFGKVAKKTWTDSDGNVQERRVQWMKDGEEYYVLLV